MRSSLSILAIAAMVLIMFSGADSIKNEDSAHIDEIEDCVHNLLLEAFNFGFQTGFNFAAHDIITISEVSSRRLSVQTAPCLAQLITGSIPKESDFEIHKQPEKNAELAQDGEWSYEKIQGWVKDNHGPVEDFTKENPGQILCLVLGLGGATLAAAPSLASAPLLWLTGFGPGGVAAGSWAAGIHSGIGIVGAGTKFAIMQSAGAGGAGLAVVNSAIQRGAWVVAGSSALYIGVSEFLSDDGAKKSEGEEKSWFDSWL